MNTLNDLYNLIEYIDEQERINTLKQERLNALNEIIYLLGVYNNGIVEYYITRMLKSDLFNEHIDPYSPMDDIDFFMQPLFILVFIFFYNNICYFFGF